MSFQSCVRLAVRTKYSLPPTLCAPYRTTQAYMCSGICCGYGASNSPHNQAEIDAQCTGQANVTTAVQKYLIANGGWEAQKCFNYLSTKTLPSANDSPAECAAKLTKTAAWASDHSNYNAVVAYVDVLVSTFTWSSISLHPSQCATSARCIVVLQQSLSLFDALCVPPPTACTPGLQPESGSMHSNTCALHHYHTYT